MHGIIAVMPLSFSFGLITLTLLPSVVNLVILGGVGAVFLFILVAFA